MNLIESGIPYLRDPFILEKNGIYYAYGTGWVCYKNSKGKLDSGWEVPISVVEKPLDFLCDSWAPEVHFYNGFYYMFTTYKSSISQHRGCAVFRSDNPMGPFVLWSDGHFTPDSWDSIDATFYVDQSGQPWTVFVHEWTSTQDGIGTMVCAKLSADLRKIISEPTVLFRADDVSWAAAGITDGCYLKTLSNEALIMIWSNFSKDGYSVGILESESGKITGPWKHNNNLLYTKNSKYPFDGGHGMFFKALDGKTYLSIHAPNEPTAERKEMPIFIPVNEDLLRNTVTLDF